MQETISMAYNVEVDQDLIVDGRLHAMTLIQEAYRLLLPYVGGCRGCADDLFGVIANQVIDKLNAASTPGVVLHLGEPENCLTAQLAHLERETASTAKMLGRDQTHH